MDETVRPTNGSTGFPASGSEMARRIREHDWAGTPLGPLELWPLPLRTLLDVMLGSNQPMFVTWGPERTLVYNDPYCQILARKHPDALGRPFLDVWHEIRDDLMPIVEQVYCGEPVQMDDIPLVMERKGYPEEAHFAFSYTPVQDGGGAVAGIFCACQEITGQVLAERQLRQSEARLRGVLEGMGEAFCLLDRDFRILAFNRAALLLETRPSEAILGRSHWEVFPGSEDSEVGHLYRRALEERRPVVLEHRHTWADGTARWTEMRAHPVPEGLAVFWRDISERKEGEERLRESEARFRLMADASPQIIWITDGEGRTEFFNKQWAGYVGAPDIPPTAGDVARSYVHPDDQAATMEAFSQARRAGTTFQAEHRIRSAAGEYRWFLVRGEPYRDPETGEIARWFGVSVDIHDRRQVEAELRESEERFRAIVETATDYAILTTDADGRIETWPAGAQTIFGWTAEEAIGQPVDMTFAPEDRAIGAPETERLSASTAGQSPNVRWHLRKDGSRVFIDGIMRPLRDKGGTLTGFVKVGQDVTERRATEEALRKSEELYRTLFDTVEAGFCVVEMIFDEAQRPIDYRFIEANPAFARHTGLPDPVGRTARELVPGLEQHWFDLYGEVALTGAPARFENGSRSMGRWFEVRAQRVGAPEARRVALLFSDITERRRMEERLRDLNESLEARVAERTAERDRMWETSPDLMTVIDFDGVFRQVNPAWTAILGYEPEELVGHRVNEFVLADNREETVAAHEMASDGGQPRIENRYRHKDGSTRWISWTAAPAGDVTYATGRDITAEKERQAELEAAQEALRQSQKMEAVGQLTGGLAHDFNNLLAGISGSLELMATRLSQGRLGEVDRYLAAAQGASRRAAALTHRLLAFSRRQTLAPKVTDVSTLVAGMEELIRRTVGPQVVVESVTESGVWPVEIDPNQLENALLNLAINARDAMPEGGRISVETANVCLDARAARDQELSPGQYVSLSVSDTGAGMAPEVVARAFDPFFTTKPLGLGTGLGLSMVYGFARQSGGQVRIHSELGRGTTVRLYLPRHLGADDEQEASPETGAEVPPGAGETVLVIDDEPVVRMLVVDVLEELGYAALEAADGPEGLKVLESRARVDLLVTDVGLPGGLNGRQVADAARALRPELKVLFITGYAETAVLNHGHLDAELHVITKPFAVEDLGRRIRAILSEA